MNFDYSMAEGVKKSFVTHYRENLRKAIKFKTGIAISKADMKDVLRTIKEEYKLQPTLEVNERYKEIELEKLTNRFNLDAVTVNESQSLAQTEAYNDTDRETFQAMEAFIHNLNTMHSRAGAQVPFSSINYEMDVSQEARMAIKNILLTTEKGLGNGETPIFPIQIFRVKNGISANPGDPNYDLFQLAIRCSAKRLFPKLIGAICSNAYRKPCEPRNLGCGQLAC